MTRREILLSACALAGTPGQLSAAQLQNNVQQFPPTSQAPAEAASLSDYEALARERIPHMAYEYISGGAADEITLRWNRESFDRIRLRPKILVDVSKLDTRLTLFGQELPFPILLAPTAYHRLVHPEGEIATVKGAALGGATLIASMLATTTIEEMAKAATRPLWFQTYILKDRGFTRDLVQRAEAAGCKALCVTVDSPVVGVRNRDQRARFALPTEMERANLKGLMRPGGNLRPPEGDIYTPILDASLAWKEIDWLRSIARAPVLLKGVLNPDDADRAVKAGASGIIVSNHGARNLDTVPATIDALPEVVDKVAGRIPILMDSGVRRGTDVLKALAMGATATLIGRPYLYGLGVAGSEGGRSGVNIFPTEFKIAMALAGRASLRDIERTTPWFEKPCNLPTPH